MADQPTPSAFTDEAIDQLAQRLHDDARDPVFPAWAELPGAYQDVWRSRAREYAAILAPKVWLAHHTLVGRFTDGERIVVPGMAGSYPDEARNRWGRVVGVEQKVVCRVDERLIVWLDDDEGPRAINPDVVAHGSDWRYAGDPKKNKEPVRG